MKSNNKCFLLVVLAIISLAFGITSTSALEIINYNGIKISPNEYNNLLNLGFTENQIYYMDKETYNINKDLDAKLLSQTKRYYKTEYTMYGVGTTKEITPEEYYNDTKKVVLTKGIVQTQYKTVVSSIAQSGNKYRYNVGMSWSSMPSNRSFDIIGIGFADDVYISSSVYFNFTWANSAGQYTTSTQYYNKKSTSTGGSAVYKLPSGTIKALSANLHFDVSKDTTNTITTLGICGDYSHATSTVSSSNVANYGISIYGISLGSGLAGHYDAIPCAMEYANVNW